MWRLSSEGKCATGWREECTAPLGDCLHRVAVLDGSVPEFRPTVKGVAFRADGENGVYFLCRVPGCDERRMEPGKMAFPYAR